MNKDRFKKNSFWCWTFDHVIRGKNALPYLKGWIKYDIHNIYHWIKFDVFHVKKYPRELQLPITYHCNFDCIMCGMKAQSTKTHYTPEELEQILNKRLFKEIRSVGIGGGEPFLRNDIEKCVDVLIRCLPELKSVSIISNGYLTENICDKLVLIRQVCKKNAIVLNVSISIDGIYDMQDYMRGKEGAFVHVENTCKKLLENKTLYCDYLQAICTITKKNIERINEVDVWAKHMQIPVAYNVATVNERLMNEDRVDNFTVWNDKESKLLTAEFFLKKSYETGDMKYWALYYLLYFGKRIAACTYQSQRGITLTADGQIAFCATHSKTMGSALTDDVDQLYYGNKKYQREIKNNYCNTCSHYSFELNRDGYKARFIEAWKIGR